MTDAELLRFLERDGQRVNYVFNHKGEWRVRLLAHDGAPRLYGKGDTLAAAIGAALAAPPLRPARPLRGPTTAAAARWR